MEGCFMFQWVFCFSDGGTSFLSGGGGRGGGAKAVRKAVKQFDTW